MSGGFIILDAILALALGTIFISIIFYGSNIASDTVMKAKIRSENIIEPQFDLGIGNIITARSDPLCSKDFLSSAKAIPMENTRKINLPIPANIFLTHIEVRNGFIYVSADSNQMQDPDLYVIDIHNPDTPTVVASINTGPGISDFVLIGKYIFVTAASTATQLHILQQDNTRHISLIKKYQLPLPYATATPPYATAIDYANGRVFVGTEKWDGNEFVSMNVSIPNSPQFLSGFEIGNKVNEIIAQSNYAYVSSAGEGQLRIFNISDPTQTKLVSTFSPSGWNRQEGKAVSILNSHLVFSRTSGGYDIGNDKELFYWLATSTPGHTEYSQNIPGGVYGIVQDERKIYVATRQTGKELMIFDATNFLVNSDFLIDPKSPSLELPQSMTCDSSFIYMLSHLSPTIYEISFN